MFGSLRRRRYYDDWDEFDDELYYDDYDLDYALDYAGDRPHRRHRCNHKRQGGFSWWGKIISVVLLFLFLPFNLFSSPFSFFSPGVSFWVAL